jgi:uracil-DNA glycosylase
VTTQERDTVIPAVREWLRNERRLGVPHWSVPPGAPIAPNPKAAPVSALPREGARPTAPSSPPTPAPVAGERPSALFAAAPTSGKPFPDDPRLPAACTIELPIADAQAALAGLDADFVRGCTKCRLHEHRTQTVFGVGHARADLVFVGEGPGADEDAQGIPFVGRAGQLLTRMIAAMTLTREQVYICNVVKCRPPGNRTPTEDEMEACGPYLFRQLAILRPRIIVALGRPASQTLLATKVPISRLRGELHDFPPPALAHLGLPTTKLMPTFHPAYLLRNPPAKSDAWKDLQVVMQFLGLTPPRGR